MGADNAKKYFILFILLAFGALCVNVFGQSAEPFEVKVTGHGDKAIILIPGFASSGAVWDDTREIFEKDHLCYTLTMAGFAGVPAKSETTFKAWEKAIADYILKHKISKPVIIGHSMGGAMALAIAADYPDLPSQIVIVDALPFLAAMRDPSIQAKEKPDCAGAIAQIKAMSDAQFRQMQQGSMTMLMADTIHRRDVIEWSMRSDRGVFAGMYCDFFNTDLRSKLGSIKCPAMVLLESYFANFKPAIEDQYKLLQTGDYRYATKGLHFIMYDDKDWYETQLKNFVG
ncbi:MAG: alpha/beta hydrolase [Bacteroidetes bacterium]|nr:alpha/beta hydrolase [Bacteroidota bacterium]